MAQKIYSRKKVTEFARNYIQFLKKEYNLPIEQAYLFGSYAKNTPHEWSDIDICIVSPRFEKTDPLVYLWKRRRPIDIDRRIEPYGLTPSDVVDEHPVLREARKAGVRLV